ncbi:MAG: hypothetical protein II485_02515 [Firmicutes bacterium]|nr:hypothetical protein [Bacillota bacterium]
MEKTLKLQKRHCFFTMFSSAAVIICVCIGVTMNLTTIFDENFDHMGLRTFCMFTVLSNILCAIGMALVFPYTMDGARKHNFHVPKWVIVFLHMGVTSVALTLIISLTILAPFKGFVLIFTGSRLFLHGICPILAIIAFCFFISEKRLGIGDSFFALIPVFIYTCLYFIMVVVIGEENGGWDDFYGFATHLPVWIPLTVILPLTFGIATVLRLLHNRAYDIRHLREAEAYREIFKDIDLRELVGVMATNLKNKAKGRDIVIPGRVLDIMIENNDGDCTWEEACEIYLKEYLASSKVMDLKKLWI